MLVYAVARDIFNRFGWQTGKPTTHYFILFYFEKCWKSLWLFSSFLDGCNECYLGLRLVIVRVINLASSIHVTGKKDGVSTN